MTDLHNPIFTDLDKAREALEAVRWPTGPFCPHCGSVDRIAKVEGEKHRPGLFYCNECKGQFTVTVGTIFERSKIPLTKWWLAVHLLSSSKKGMSSHQLHRMLGVTYKTAWFMSHRIREAMHDMSTTPLGGNGGTVEADETYIGRKRNRKVRPGAGHKHTVMALVERGGKARSFHVKDASGPSIRPLVRKNVSRKAHLPRRTSSMPEMRPPSLFRPGRFASWRRSYLCRLRRALHGRKRHPRRYACGRDQEARPKGDVLARAKMGLPEGPRGVRRHHLRKPLSQTPLPLGFSFSDPPLRDCRPHSNSYLRQPVISGH